MSEPRIINAKIKSTFLGVEDHGIMLFFLDIEWPGATCGFGGYTLDKRDLDKPKTRIGLGYSYQAIRHILETLNVASWEKLPGTLIRIEYSPLGSPLHKIGHIMEEKWFDLRDYMKQEEGA